MTDDGIKHGTTGGYKYCRQRPEGSCDDCRKVRAAAVRRWRRPALDLKEAEEQARHALAAARPDEFERLVAEELRKITETRRAL